MSMLQEFVQIAQGNDWNSHTNFRRSAGHSHSHDSGSEEVVNDMMGARISSVFVMLVASGIGAFFPILASRYSFIRMPSWVFFFCKYFGSGVIIATAFIHLLYEANLSLSSESLPEAWGNYPYAIGILLVTLFSIFLMELLARKYVEKKVGVDAVHTHSHFGNESAYVNKPAVFDEDSDLARSKDQQDIDSKDPAQFSKAANYEDKESLTPVSTKEDEYFFGQLVSVSVLEFGILFHSVFVGLTLGVSGDEFKILYVVIVFHQFFEGLGLGSRIASIVWPKDKRWTPWVFAAGFMLVTPIAIAIGLGVRQTYASDSPRALITAGIFDSVSAGILIYSGLVELMAHEFLFTDEFKGPGGTTRMLKAFFTMCLGCGLMALLGRWA